MWLTYNYRHGGIELWPSDDAMGRKGNKSASETLRLIFAEMVHINRRWNRADRADGAVAVVMPTDNSNKTRWRPGIDVRNTRIEPPTCLDRKNDSKILNNYPSPNNNYGILQRGSSYK